MKTYILFFLSIFSFYSVSAQFAAPIEISSNGTPSVAIADIDGDGNIDLVYQNLFTGDLVWRANSGDGVFGEERLIQIFIPLRTKVFVADINGDGYLDVLIGSETDNKVSWYENLDGMGNFGPRQVIMTEVMGVVDVRVGDINGDGFMDVLAVANIGNFVTWTKNLDGLGNFGPQQIISSDFVAPVDINLADIDGDGDMDVLVASWFEDKLVLFENLDGLGTFGQKQTIESGTGAIQILAADLDGDGDLDILGSFFDGKLAWYKNTDGQGNFGPAEIIVPEVSSLNDKNIFLVDMDNDGDLDIVSISYFGSLTWFENIDAQGTLGPEISISQVPTRMLQVFASDFDGDGDLDIITSGNNILYFENIGSMGISDLTVAGISVYPNPVRDFLNIDIHKPSNIKSIALYDLLGKKLMVVNKYIPSLDISNLSTGMYVLEIKTDNGIFTSKIVKD